MTSAPVVGRLAHALGLRTFDEVYEYVYRKRPTDEPDGHQVEEVEEPLRESRVWSETETEIELWPCQPIASWPSQARDASDSTFKELARLLVFCEVLVRAPRSRAPSHGWDRITNAVLVARFVPSTPTPGHRDMDYIENEEGQEIAITPSLLAVQWVSMMNYHAFLPVEGPAVVGHPDDVRNVLKEEAQLSAAERTVPCAQQAELQGTCTSSTG